MKNEYGKRRFPPEGEEALPIGFVNGTAGWGRAHVRS